MTIFVDRLIPIAQRTPNRAVALLGHVLAHEIGHILQGVSRHSDRGVLKERWSKSEIDMMAWERLRFTDYDAKLIVEAITGGSAMRSKQPIAEVVQ